MISKPQWYKFPNRLIAKRGLAFVWIGLGTKAWKGGYLMCDVKCVLQGHPNAGFQTWLVSKSCILALEANPRSYSPAP